MAHPYSKHNEHEKSHHRVGHILKHEPAESRQHEDHTSFSRVTSKHHAVKHDEGHGAPGKKAPGRYARGGKVKEKGHQTNIAIVVPHKSPPPAAAGPQAGAGAPPPALAPAPPMGGPPPGLAGPGGPGGPMPPMRARGGKVASGISTAENLKKWSDRATEHSYARGGGLPTAGAATGVARKQMADHMRGGKKK